MSGRITRLLLFHFAPLDSLGGIEDTKLYTHTNTHIFDSCEASSAWLEQVRHIDLKMGFTQPSTTIGVSLLSLVVYVLSIGYKRRAKINKLRKQGVVSQKSSHYSPNVNIEATRQCRNGTGGQDIF